MKILLMLCGLLILLQTVVAQTPPDLGILNDKAKFSLLIDRAKDSIKKNNLEAAVTDLSAAIKLEPNNEEGYTQRARAYILLKNFSAAFADSEKALGLNPKYVEALNVRGLVKVERKELDSAIADFTSAISIKPDFFKPYLNRARIFIEREEFEKAVADYNEVIKFNKNDGYLFSLRGFVYLYSIKNYDLAIKDYTEAIKLNPNSNSYYFSRGQAFLKKSSFNEAIADYNKAIEIDPTDKFSYYFRGNAYNALNKTEQATADYKKAVELDPTYGPFTLALAGIAKEDSDQIGVSSGQTPVKSEDDLEKELLQLIKDVVKQSAVFNEKLNAKNKANESSLTNQTAFCKSLTELEDITPPLEATIDKLSKMYKSGDLEKVANGKLQEDVKQIIDQQNKILKEKADVTMDIKLFRCREKH